MSRAESESPQKDGKVIDPVTHQPVTIHDNTSDELGGVQFGSGSGSGSSTEQLHDAMRPLLLREAQLPRWKESDSQRVKLQFAGVAGLAAGFGCGVSMLASVLGLGWFVAGVMPALVASVAATGMFFLFPANSKREEPQAEPEPEEVRLLLFRLSLLIGIREKVRQKAHCG